MFTKKSLIIIILLAAALLVTSRWHWNFFDEENVQGVTEVQITNIKERLEVIFLDVGQGDAILIETPKGQQILLDGGEGQTILEKLGQYLPLTDRTIELLILSHPHSDHLDGLVEVLKRYTIKEVWLTGVVRTSSGYLEFLNLIKHKKIPVKNIFACGTSNAVECSDEITLEDKVRFKVLWPRENLAEKRVEDLNNTSLVLKLIYQNNSWLLPGDLDSAAEEQLAKDNSEELKADILKVAHHGSSSATSEEFLRLVSPTDAIISVGAPNDYGHPSPRILNRLKRAGINIWRTDEQEDILTVGNGSVIEIANP
ncbi:MAG TPA: ComEC/Rec2 family competence protein [Patescibacteria group bacterium]|nr:ComEC/Rec2 family competence protein [Patescibacteria group bacterium]